jgi:uncharacterized membrane protein YqhA
MSKKTKQKSTSTSGFIFRTRLIIVAALLLVLAGGGAVYGLSMYQSKIVTITDIPTVKT